MGRPQEGGGDRGRERARKRLGRGKEIERGGEKTSLERVAALSGWERSFGQCSSTQLYGNLI